MRSNNRVGMTLGVAVVAALLMSNASAQCGSRKAQLKQQSWDGISNTASLLRVDQALDPIVGMWHVTFTAQGNEAGPPDGTPIDNSIVVWHSDGTEIMNSSRPAQDGNICLGIWQKTGRFTYKLNHLPWAGNDPTNAPSGIGDPQGGAQIFQEITLSADGNHYTGRFTLDAYDPSGNSTAHIVSVITATRLTVNTKMRDLL